MTHYADLIRSLADQDALRTLRDQIDATLIIEDAIALQQIPAPTFDEKARARVVEEIFKGYGLRNVRMDEVYNVYGRRPGHDPQRPALLVSAHTDTVFPADTDLTIREKGDRIYGPGLGDNSLGVAGLIALLRLLQLGDVTPTSDIWFVANSREEGLGDLGGIRAVWDVLGPRLGAAIVLEGMALGRIYHAGIAVRRLHITCHAPGGHSWLHFGHPSAVHGLIDLGARIIRHQPPQHPRTTYNIGLISGGHSVNSLATEAELYLDLRSEAPESLADLEQRVRSDVAAVQQSNMTFEVTVVGDRPAGRINREHGLAQLAAAALEIIDYQPAFESGSTDANVLLAHALPTVTVGLTHGGQAHRLDEYIETAPIADGLWHILLLTLAAAESLHTWTNN